MVSFRNPPQVAILNTPRVQADSLSRLKSIRSSILQPKKFCTSVQSGWRIATDIGYGLHAA